MIVLEERSERNGGSADGFEGTLRASAILAVKKALCGEGLSQGDEISAVSGNKLVVGDSTMTLAGDSGDSTCRSVAVKLRFLWRKLGLGPGWDFRCDPRRRIAGAGAGGAETGEEGVITIEVTGSEGVSSKDSGESEMSGVRRFALESTELCDFELFCSEVDNL